MHQGRGKGWYQLDELLDQFVEAFVARLELLVVEPLDHVQIIFLCARPRE
jgi:hypothetical protein